MQPPKDIPLQEYAHGSGEKGMAFYIYRNNEHGIQVDARRAKDGAPWVEIWTADLMPNRFFKEWGDLHRALIDAGDTLTTGSYPKVIEVRPRPEKVNGGTCWLCRAPEWKHSVRVQTGWRKMDVKWIDCCDADLDKAKADPAAAIAARLKFVAEGNRLAFMRLSNAKPN